MLRSKKTFTQCGLLLVASALLAMTSGLASSGEAAEPEQTEGLLYCPELDLIFDDQEKLKEKRRDSNANCQVDQVIEYENEKAVRAREDRNHDGQEDAWTEFDEKGRPSQESFDETGDGQPDTWQERKAGVLESRSQDLNADGNPDTCCALQSRSPKS